MSERSCIVPYYRKAAISNRQALPRRWNASVWALILDRIRFMTKSPVVATRGYIRNTP